MTSDGLMPALAVLAEASATDNSGTIQGSNLHLRNRSNQDYVPKIGSHLSSEELGSIVLRVEVGSGKEPGGTATFRIHYKLLCDKIPMFKESFGDSFEQIAEPDCQIIPDVVLVNDDPSAFKLLAGWLYMDTIDGDFDKSASSAALRVLFCRIAVWQLSQNGSDGAGTMDLESILCRNEELRQDIESLKKSNEGR
ncbi:hypothetical protein DID88_004926 [Monilinia fructigena]|uniref:BTB domain-containing protein n=1 Tax=Monilinia fructigena TaxID=38457 RepID=A0A395IPZ1_9HELO|nr:hypothetical protein DID88_004926 [Monilinia fructigena]